MITVSVETPSAMAPRITRYVRNAHKKELQQEQEFQPLRHSKMKN